jgi:hypothetical protein
MSQPAVFHQQPLLASSQDRWVRPSFTTVATVISEARSRRNGETSTL